MAAAVYSQVCTSALIITPGIQKEIKQAMTPPKPPRSDAGRRPRHGDHQEPLPCLQSLVLDVLLTCPVFWSSA